MGRKVIISKYITADPAVCHGKPTFKGTRIMVYLILEMLASGETIEEILEDYPALDREHIMAAFWFAASVSEKARVGSLAK
ncbi:DUF433 domain-containing protein [Patescibacteria group bacterium]|nr:DUF433 domain-containing protein [Patescibacteria group bacterium]MBU4579613.1 DUF433 domain-containing protein [Patescibacteria group bacterium]